MKKKEKSFASIFNLLKKRDNKFQDE